MKRSFLILLTAMLLVCSLTACGRNNKNNTQTTTPPVTSQNADPSMQNNPTVPENNMTDNQTQDTLPDSTLDNNTVTDNGPGVSYEQMLRNGRVHDTDGLLRDGENAVSDITKDVGNAARNVVRSGERAVKDMMR